MELTRELKTQLFSVRVTLADHRKLLALAEIAGKPNCVAAGVDMLLLAAPDKPAELLEKFGELREWYECRNKKGAPTGAPA